MTWSFVFLVSKLGTLSHQIQSKQEKNKPNKQINPKEINRPWKPKADCIKVVLEKPQLSFSWNRHQWGLPFKGTVICPACCISESHDTKRKYQTSILLQEYPATLVFQRRHSQDDLSFQKAAKRRLWCSVEQWEALSHGYYGPFSWEPGKMPLSCWVIWSSLAGVHSPAQSGTCLALCFTPVLSKATAQANCPQNISLSNRHLFLITQYFYIIPIFSSQPRHFTFLKGCCGLGLTLLLESNNKVNHCNTYIRNIRGQISNVTMWK